MDSSQPKYFAFIDGREQGPFSLSQLQGAGVRPSTFVWCKGMSDWQRADSIEEIKDYFRGKINTSKPEPINITPAGESRKEKEEAQQTRPPRFSRFGISAEDAPDPEPDLNSPPQISMALAIFSIICFPPTAIAAIWYTRKAQKEWTSSLNPNMDNETATNLRKNAHEQARLAKMWIGLSIAFGIIFWTLIFSL